jgi:ABC-2 type transport system ATP-binding protein
MIVKVQELRRYFGDTRAVDGVSFTIESGQIFGFVGPNGAGKTTTMRILATMDEPTAGDATVNGRSVVENPEEARRCIGYVPDSLPVHRDMNVHDYLDFFARAYGLRHPHRPRLVRGVEEFTNLTGILDKTLGALSKGMKQRVSLARALVHDPALLIMDEPAAGLDPRARIELRELLKALAAQGKAILISSHILSDLAEICDGALFIERGRMLAAGTMGQLLNHDTGSAAVQRTVLIRPLQGVEELHKALLQMPQILAVRADGRGLEADVAGADEQCSQLLSELVRRDFRIAEFRLRTTDLEDVFMKVTTGKVQ